MKKLTIVMMVMIFAALNFTQAQIIPAVGQLLGQRQAGTYGDFNAQWIGLGQPPGVPSVYGYRAQWNGNAGILALTGTGANKHLELNFGGPGKTGRFEINKINSFTDPNAKSNFFSVLHDGKIGVGTRSPAYKFQVQGDIYANGGWVRVSGNRGLYFQTYGGGLYMADHTWIRTAGSKSFYHNTGIMRTDGTFQVGPNGNRFIVNTAGHTGIGQTAPKGPLHVGQQLVISSPHTNGGWGGIAMNMYWNGSLKRVVSDQSADMIFTNHGDIVFRTAPYGNANTTITNIKHILKVHNDRGVSVMTDNLPSGVQFNVQGNLTATNHWNTSDGRFKKNVKDINNALDIVNALNGKSYQFKEKVGDYDFKAVQGQDQLGFIAAELKEVLPELVMEDDNGYQSVNYTGVIPVLVEAMKEQQNVIDEQETTITELNKTVESLETRLERLEALLNDSDLGSIDNTRPVNTNTTDFSGIVLKQNAPNPFKGITTIDYEIPAELGTASLVVYDLNGKTIATYNIADKGMVRFDASNLSNGTYAYAIVVNGQSIATQKMIIQK